VNAFHQLINARNSSLRSPGFPFGGGYASVAGGGVRVPAIAESPSQSLTPAQTELALKYMDKGHTTFATAAAQVHGQSMDLISEGLKAHRQDILTVVTAGAR